MFVRFVEYRVVLVATKQPSKPQTRSILNGKFVVNTKAQSIAIVDDDPLVRSALVDLLRENGFEPHAFSGSETLKKMRHYPFDLFLIDWRLSNENGLDIVRDIFQTKQAPVIMMSGVSDEIDKAIGLEAGADDYISKPFNPRELIARIRALLRRFSSSDTQALQSQQSNQSNLIRFGDLALNLSCRELKNMDGQEVSLTNAEYRLLEYLVIHQGRIIGRSELLNYLGSDLAQFVDRSVDVMILRLRGKIEISPSKPVHLQTRRGKGYVFVLSPSVR